MNLPIGDDNTGRTTAPVVNYAIIAVNLLVFVFLQGMGTNERFTYAFSTVPEFSGSLPSRRTSSCNSPTKLARCRE